MSQIWEIRWQGRGGQGIVTAARLFAEAAHGYDGFVGVTAMPSFGAERRGAPISASSRISDVPVVLRSQVTRADILVVFDPTLLSSSMADQLKPGASVVANVPSLEVLRGYFEQARLLVQVDASAIALEENMLSSGSPLVGSAMLGAMLKAFPMVRLSSIKACLEQRFSGSSQVRNVAMAQKGFERSNQWEAP